MLVLFSLLFVTVFCAAPVRPNFNNDFTAEVHYHIQRGNDPPRDFNGHWLSDKTGMRDRYDVEIAGTGRVDIWQIWNSTKTGYEYILEMATQKCRKSPFTLEFHGPFDFDQSATLVGACDGTGAKWQFIIPGAWEFDLCSNPEGTRPYWVEYKQLVAPKFHEIVRFHSYHPGRPDASNYIIPAVCANAK
jgi:hypothetical protein